jgi:uncharacterized protein YggE
MKKTIFIALFVTAVLVTPAMAQSDEFPRTLTMEGEGEVKAVPDMAEVTAGVTTAAPAAAAALSANTDRMRGVFAAIEQLGVPEKNIRTVNFSIAPQYTGGGNNIPPRLTGYQANNEVSVRLDDVGKLGGALDALVTAGANQMNGIRFSVKDPAPLLTEARAAAVADARAKAETYAKAAGMSLGPILSISENGDNMPRPLPMARMMVAAAPPPVAAGEQSVSANVSIVWEIH